MSKLKMEETKERKKGSGRGEGRKTYYALRIQSMNYSESVFFVLILY